MYCPYDSSDTSNDAFFPSGISRKVIIYLFLVYGACILVATPRHNGKVERQHRTDEKRFYKKMKMYNLADGRKQLQRYNKKSNNIPKTCLGFLTPNEVLDKYLAVMQTIRRKAQKRLHQ